MAGHGKTSIAYLEGKAKILQCAATTGCSWLQTSGFLLELRGLGHCMVYLFDKANANAPSTRKTQYFEMIANRGIYHRAGTPTRCLRMARGF